MLCSAASVHSFRYASDFSGIDAPAMAVERAIQNMDLHLDFLSSSELCARKRSILHKNFHPREIRKNAKTLANARFVNIVDLYTAGFPCMDYSRAGFRRGAASARGREGYRAVIKQVEHLRPLKLLLENVPEFASSDKGRPFDELISALRRLGYTIDWKILNTLHYGTPHSRKRLFIVGIRGNAHPFDWPDVVPMMPLSMFLKPRTRTDRSTRLPGRTEAAARQKVIVTLGRCSHLDLENNDYIVDIDSSKPGLPKPWCPTQTARRRYGHWIISRGRRVAPSEVLKLSNFDADRYIWPSESQLIYKYVGESMTVDLVTRLVQGLLVWQCCSPTLYTQLDAATIEIDSTSDNSILNSADADAAAAQDDSSDVHACGAV